MSRAEFGPEAVAYGLAAEPAAAYARAGGTGGGYLASNGYRSGAAEPDWTDAPEGQFWQDWQDQDWGPPPALHPDHPSAPVPRVQLPADHPSGPMQTPRAFLAHGPTGTGSVPSPGGRAMLRPLPPDRETGGPRSARSAPQPSRGFGQARASGRHAAVTPAETAGYVAAAAAGAAAGQVHADAAGFQREHGLPRRESNGFPREPGLPRRESNGFQREHGLPRRESNGFQRERGLPRRDTNGFQRQPGSPRRDSARYQRQAGPGWQETTDYRSETGPFGPGPGPAAARPQNGRSPDGDSQWMAGQVVTAADARAAQFARQAQDNAIAIREAAEREAAVITEQAAGHAAAVREAAEREAAELRSQLDSMLGELGRMAAFVTENLPSPTMPDIGPVVPGARPDPARTRSPMPGTARALPAAPADLPGGTSVPRPTRPDTRRARPDAGPGTRPAGPARLKPAPTGKPQGRQQRAMRVFTWTTAAALVLALAAGATEIGLHGMSFFLLRENGIGQTSDNVTDQSFLAQQAKAAHNAASSKGRHAKPSGQTTQSTTNN